MIQQIVRICDSLDRFLRKSFFFPKNFLNFSSHTIEKQVNINLNSNCRNNYAFIVLRNSKVAFLWEGEDLFFLVCFVYESLISLSSRSISLKPAAFLLLFYLFIFHFLSTVSNSFSVNSQSLISSWPFIFFCRFIGDFIRVTKQILEMFFPLLKSFSLVGNFLFCSRSAFPSAHFIYRLPCPSSSGFLIWFDLGSIQGVVFGMF